MKIKQIVQLCRKSGKMIILRGNDDVQWLGDGESMYPLYDAPLYDESSLYAAYDINESQRSKILFKHADIEKMKICFADEDATETQTDKSDISIEYADRKLAAFHTQEGILFLDKKYLAPLKDMEGAEVFLRYTNDNMPYFAVKLGFMICGVIMPVNIIDEKFTEQLHSLYRQCELSLLNQREKK